MTFQKTSNLVFIDTKVQDYQQLFDGVVSGAIPFVINTATDGIQQINQVLEQYPGKKTVHIISHGAPGCLYLGNSELSLETLKQYTPTIKQWNIDKLLIYGCHVASGDAGKEFMNKLQTLTGSNISASKSLTGAAVKGGNWDLEFTTSQNESSLALSETTIVAYNGVLNLLVTEDEYKTLKALYQNTNGDDWKYNGGWREWDFNSTTPPSYGTIDSWYGIALETQFNYASINIIDLDNNNLTGEIPKELGNLYNLKYLRLNNNNLTGEIPKGLGNSSKLKSLSLNNNNLTGEIPKELANSGILEYIYLNNNNLTGEIPKELGNPSSLRGLFLNNNELTGKIPKELGNLSNIKLGDLYLNNNKLTGEIPAELGNLSRLGSLYLNNNKLTGEIPG
ncbi:MAG: DUF4347 domain-containing protein, partial [Trichodesmium sp. St19_bin1]|nr:DUF4347 domain-containing protein [Trichodesmium sp. St19_bin1]